MKLVSFTYKDKKKIGHIYNSGDIVDLSTFLNCNDMLDFINSGNIENKELKEYIDSKETIKYKQEEVNLELPLKPRSLRDAYAFRQHVETSRRNRGLQMIKEFDDFPVYYYSNSDGVIGPGNVNVDEIFINKLDFELEVAIIIGKEGKNISIKEADNHIAGFMIMNDFSARDMQMQEMKLNLGPAKGKDFATSLGPYILTTDELFNYTTNTEYGKQYKLDMKCYINDEIVSEDNLGNMSWTFAQIIERISMGTTIYPGDVIGSGTCATGCFLELNQSGNERWLSRGDEIILEVEKLGKLKNRIV